MFKRLEDTILTAINDVFRHPKYDFSKWWEDDFESDYMYDSKEELKSFSESDLECVKSDWIQWVVDGFVAKICEELGISMEIETTRQEVLIEEIYEIVKLELRQKLERETCIEQQEVRIEEEGKICK